MYNLMIIDDEPLTREYLKIQIPLLNEKFHVSAEAMDGSEAWDILQKQKVDLVITDIKMPIMDGLELSRNISQHFPRQKIIILSGYDEFALAKEAMHYGVYDFLLKPIVLEELAKALNKISIELEREASENLAYHTLSNVSKDMKTQVVKNFLKAAVSDGNVEIKALYPLIYRLNVSLLEAEAIVMMMDLDTDTIFEKSVPARDIPIFKFILHQVATEITEEESWGTVFFDEHQHTIVFVPGENEDEIVQKCKMIHEKASFFIQQITGITVTSAIGSIEDDVFQLNSSYHKARRIMQCRLFSRGNHFFAYNESQHELKLIHELEQSTASILSELLNNNEVAYAMAIKRVVEFIDHLTVSNVFKLGIYLIESISQLRREKSTDLIEYALNHLKTNIQAHSDPLSKNETISLYMGLVNFFSMHNSPNQDQLNEHDIVFKMKEYIYAHYSEPLSLADIAEYIGVSSNYLSNVFHKRVNESYIKFLTRVRMEQAAKLLCAIPSEKIYDISEKVGYLSVKHFSYVFKKYFGMPPSDYQEMNIIK
ncbi:two-component system, response regulator YesN [Paenibacillus sp. yr247]|nr:two-component system, response regulator YesN [Paenibacillus sp. yr247]